MRAKSAEVDGAMRSMCASLLLGIDVYSLDRWRFDAKARRSALQTLWAWVKAKP